jgi:plasmid stability protein
MRTTLTIRLASGEREALATRAAQAGISVSELVREILRRALAERSVTARAGHLRAASS